MAVFEYVAINADGVELRGEMTAPDVSTVRAQLSGYGLLPASVDQRSGETIASKEISFSKGVKPKSLQIFSRQLATMIESGLNVVTALAILEEQTDDKKLAEVITQVREDVEGGEVLSKALARHGTVFSRLYIAMIEAGEAAGILDHVLDRMAVQLEKETQLKRRVKGAMLYPSIVLVFATLVLVGMLLFLVPIFVDIFKQYGGELPKLTELVLGASSVLRHQWFIVFPLVGASIYGLRRLKRTEQGQHAWDMLKLRLPMRIGDVALKVTMARFSRTLSTLVAAGVDIIKSLEITAQTAGNSVIENALLEVRERVNEGVPLASPLLEDPFFPPMVGHMVKVGEETGELERMLTKIADFYEDEVDAAVQSLTSIIEPIMMIAVGAMVGVIIISMYLPMFKMLTLVK
jgi:type IV pilus assembly protein PilC